MSFFDGGTLCCSSMEEQVMLCMSNCDDLVGGRLCLAVLNATALLSEELIDGVIQCKMLFSGGAALYCEGSVRSATMRRFENN